jgi:hypothetical protein
VAATVINQLSANQTAMWVHMQNLLLQDHAPPTHVANLVVYNPPHNAAAFQDPHQAPPIHVLTVLAPFQAGRRGGGADREVALGIVLVRGVVVPILLGPGDAEQEQYMYLVELSNLHMVHTLQP